MIHAEETGAADKSAATGWNQTLQIRTEQRVEGSETKTEWWVSKNEVKVT